MEGNKLEKGQMQRFSTTSKSTFQHKKYQYKRVDKEAIPFMESKSLILDKKFDIGMPE